MSSGHYQFRPYNNLPYLYNDAYIVPNYAAWQNYTVPFGTFPGDFYVPHNFYPRNEFNQTQAVVVKQTDDGAWCPQQTTVVKDFNGTSFCSFNGRKIQAVKSLAEAESSVSWPSDIQLNTINN